MYLLFSVYDASSKFPTGILIGRSFDFGNFDECLKTVTTDLEFKPQYCVINIRFSPSEKLYPNYYNNTSFKLKPTDSAWEATKVCYLHKYIPFLLFLYHC